MMHTSTALSILIAVVSCQSLVHFAQSQPTELIPLEQWKKHYAEIFGDNAKLLPGDELLQLVNKMYGCLGRVATDMSITDQMILTMRLWNRFLNTMNVLDCNGDYIEKNRKGLVEPNAENGNVQLLFKIGKEKHEEFCRSHLSLTEPEVDDSSSWQETYDKVFKYTYTQMTPEEVGKLLHELKAKIDSDKSNSIPSNERSEVLFWIEAGVMNTTKCKQNFVDLIMGRVHRVNAKASAGSPSDSPSRKHLNLAFYAMRLLDKRTHFCNTYEKWLEIEEARARTNANLMAASYAGIY